MALVNFNGNNSNYKKIEHLLNSEQIFYKKNVLMSNHTSFKIGGLCRFVAYPETFEKAGKLVRFCKVFNFKFFFLGNGSNLLFTDSAYDGVAISSAMLNKIELLPNNEIYCESGVLLLKLCKFALFHSLSGLEFAYGIPGSLGGAVLMNAGAYGGEIKDVVFSALCLDCEGNLRVFKNDELQFSYRTSVFSNSNYFILAAKVKCVEGNQLEIKNKMNELMNKRILKQPLNFPSAGSVFKRPKGGFAAQLIESCGLKKATVGDAQVSEKHCGFIINLGKASCANVLELIELVQAKVKAQKNVLLEPEIKIIY